MSAILGILFLILAIAFEGDKATLAAICSNIWFATAVIELKMGKVK